jgi:hypothetical protein
MGFDQMMLSYNHYCVTNAKIICLFKNTLNAQSTCALTIAASPTPVTVIDQILEFGLLQKCGLEYKGAYGSSQTLITKCSIRKIQGVSDIVDVTDLQGSVTANPVEQTYFHVQLWDAAAASGVVNVDVVIEFTAIFTEPRVMSESLVARLKALGVFKELKTQ